MQKNRPKANQPVKHYKTGKYDKRWYDGNDDAEDEE